MCLAAVQGTAAWPGDGGEGAQHDLPAHLPDLPASDKDGRAQPAHGRVSQDEPAHGEAGGGQETHQASGPGPAL